MLASRQGSGTPEIRMKSANFDGRAGGKQKFATSARDPVEASHIRKPTRPPGIHGREGSHGSPASTPQGRIHPDARPKAVLGFQTDLQQPGRRNRPRSPYRCQRKPTRDSHRTNPREPFPLWKNDSHHFTPRKLYSSRYSSQPLYLLQKAKYA